MAEWAGFSVTRESVSLCSLFPHDHVLIADSLYVDLLPNVIEITPRLDSIFLSKYRRVLLSWGEENVGNRIRARCEAGWIVGASQLLHNRCAAYNSTNPQPFLPSQVGIFPLRPFHSYNIGFKTTAYSYRRPTYQVPNATAHLFSVAHIQNAGTTKCNAR